MSVRKIAVLLAAGGLAVGLVGGGVGAVFHNAVTATENISVGTFACQIVAPADGTIAGDGQSVTYTAPMIMSSAPGKDPFTFTVKNTGDIPQRLTVTTSSVSAPFSVVGYPFAPEPLAPNAAYTYNTGVQWTELGQVNAGTSGSVTWTVNCDEQPAAPAYNVGVGYWTTTGNGTGTNGFCRYAAPQAPLTLDSGTVTQVVNPDGSVTLTVAGTTGYIDTGFYVPISATAGTFTSYSVTATAGAVGLGTNLYIDPTNTGFFTWTNNCLTDKGTTDYASLATVPQGGSFTVNGASTFYVQKGPNSGNNELLSTLLTAEPANSALAVWVGVTGNGSATITAAP
jgi:hypothetical protein